MKKFIKSWTSLLSLVIIFVVVPSSFGQWVSNPEVNTKIVGDVLNPVNISAVTDGNGGGFVFWQDTKDDGVSRVYYTHFDNDARISFRTDGKRVTLSKGRQVKPIVQYGNDGKAVVLWSGTDETGKSELYVQKLSANGKLLWSDKGIKLTTTVDDVSDYSMAIDKIGNVYVTYLSKERGFLGEFKVILKKINFDGTLEGPDIVIRRSNNRMSTTQIVTDQDIGVFVFWMENQNGKSILMCKHLGWKLESAGSQVLFVSTIHKSVSDYWVNSFGKNRAYVCWQYQNNRKEINQSLISDKLESLWGKNQFLVSDRLYDKKDVRLFSDNKYLWSCWTSDSSGSKSVVLKIQNKFGKPVQFKNKGLKAYNFFNAFNPVIISDENNGAVLSWLSNKPGENSPFVFAQRISSTGEMLWEKNGITVSSSDKSEKSYLSIVPDLNGGSFVVFKDVRNKKAGIYAQRIFSNGTYVSQIVGFNTTLQGDSVHISWYAANESGPGYYILEKMNSNDTSRANWLAIDTIYTEGKIHLASYDYYDGLENPGTFYYRLSHNDEKGNSEYSEVARVNYISNSMDIIVAQNDPNPFSDSTRISFFLPKQANVSVEFFNSSIQKIDEIEKEKYSAGKHDVIFKRHELEPGIYFYRIQSDNFVEVKKMVIAKD